MYWTGSGRVECGSGTFDHIPIRGIGFLAAINRDEFEFLEFRNSGGTTLDLTGLVFSNGINFTFTNDTFLAAGNYFVLARNTAQFAVRYPGVVLRGIYTSKLDNAGERISLHLPSDAPILDAAYDNAAPGRPTRPTPGFLLQRMNSSRSVTNAANWIAAPALECRRLGELLSPRPRTGRWLG